MATVTDRFVVLVPAGLDPGDPTRFHLVETALYEAVPDMIASSYPYDHRPARVLDLAIEATFYGDPADVLALPRHCDACEAAHRDVAAVIERDPGRWAAVISATYTEGWT